MKYVLAASALLITILSISAQRAHAQWNHDITNELEIPGILDVESSPTHLYVLSESEGLIVFRTYTDSLQYLYTSTGMQRRGNQLTADIRFAYLYGSGRRLTIIEPTSVLGVYSSTVLPDAPLAAHRIGSNLYIVMNNGSLGSLSLETPESVDSEPVPVDPERLGSRVINDLATDANKILYVLSDNSQIDIYRYRSGEDSLLHEQSVSLSNRVDKIFFTENELIGSNRDGDIYLIDSDGETRFQNNVERLALKIGFWDEELVVRTKNNQIWLGDLDSDLINWKENSEAGNYFTINKNQFIVSEFNSLFPVIKTRNAQGSQPNRRQQREFAIAQLENVTIPFPKPLLLPIEIEGYGGDPADITLSVESSLDNIKIRGSSLFWQPGASDTGRHQITVTASTPSGETAEMQFTADVKPFNSPPRFTPSRPQTVPAETEFEQNITAFDPDGTHPELIRYLGMDLPSGATLDEQTGLFSWTPSIRQVGSHKFRVIATDQFGAAASQEFEMRVIEVEENDDPELDSVIDSK